MVDGVYIGYGVHTSLTSYCFEMVVAGQVNEVPTSFEPIHVHLT